MFFYNTLSQSHTPPPSIVGKIVCYKEILVQKIICWHKRQSYVDAVIRGVIVKLYEPICSVTHIQRLFYFIYFFFFLRDMLRGIPNFK
jgi:hypothetical protein